MASNDSVVGGRGGVMTKFPLDWHRQGLRNMEAHFFADERMLAAKMADLDRLRSRIEIVHMQIEEAERRGVKEFDPERFGVKRPKRVATP
jgi:hypothetical protein